MKKNYLNCPFVCHNPCLNNNESYYQIGIYQQREWLTIILSILKNLSLQLYSQLKFISQQVRHKEVIPNQFYRDQ